MVWPVFGIPRSNSPDLQIARQALGSGLAPTIERIIRWDTARATGKTTCTDATDKDVTPTIATLTVPKMELTTARAIRRSKSAIRTV